MKTSRSRIVLVILSILAGTACLCSPTGLIDAVSTPLPPTNYVAPPSTTPDYSILTDTGPRLLLATDNGLWSVVTDGRGMVQLSTEYMEQDLYTAVQPGGELVAVVTSSGDGVHNLTLQLVSIASGQVRKSIPLTTPGTEPGAESMPGDEIYEAVRAIMMDNAIAWSPDGTKLAFIGVLDGPTAEVYLYDLASDAVRRVSTDDAQDFQVSFSPDGSYMLYFGAYAFGTGAGFSMAGAWSARGDGSNVTMLFESEDSGEELIGWRDGQTAVIASWSPMCGLMKLRLYNVYTTNKLTLEEDCFGSAAVGGWEGADPKAVIFTTPQGVYFLPSNSQETYLLDGRGAYNVRFDPAGTMFIIPYIESNWETISPTADYIETAPTTAEDATMFGMIWAWTNRSGEMPGVWISGPGIEIGQIFFSSAFAPAWDTNDNTLFWCSEGNYGTQLFRATFNAYYADAAPIVDLPGTVRDMVWVEGR